jgi:hypothetical protein
VLDLRASKHHNIIDAMSEQERQPLTRKELRVLRQVRSGYARDFLSPDVREKLKSMGLIEEIDGGLVITDEGLRHIELGK